MSHFFSEKGLYPAWGIKSLPRGGEEPMISKQEVKELIADLFEQQALVIGGLVAIHKVEDDVIWRLIRNLDVIRRRFLKRLEDKDPGDDGGGPPKRPNLKPHPAIEDFLLAIRRG